MSASSHHKMMAQPHDMSSMTSSKEMQHGHHQPMLEQATSLKHHQCCCCDGSNSSCAGNCDMGVNVSLLMQPSSYAPVIINVTESIIFSAEVLLRELTPPSRPPAALS